MTPEEVYIANKPYSDITFREYLITQLWLDTPPAHREFVSPRHCIQQADKLIAAIAKDKDQDAERI